MQKMKKLWKKLKHWCCKVGLCNLDKCNCDCHDHPKGRSKAYYSSLPPKKEKVALKPNQFRDEVRKDRERHGGGTLKEARERVSKWATLDNS